ncbi:MAG: hypothetical protein GWN18_02215, partial [Thermoplasmata archaeon]|nr:hypothetical protein [Thermoplasmata archaeon]NIS10825.1 hypothetical protein [Thermoplasmata archaeon]NIV77573.1 hypothetical protein [Thermoplasmata archaeon]NIW81401.1 hypothetical protein [Thermoplasmata archaeon]NIW87610.1 hypothetical protein [Thermoplasmata archaeon]
MDVDVKTVDGNIYLETHISGLVEGVENYVQFSVFDPVRGAPTLSPEYQVRVDLTGPEFISMLPKEGDIQPNPLVTVSVVIQDNLAGVDPQE